MVDEDQFQCKLCTDLCYFSMIKCKFHTTTELDDDQNQESRDDIASAEGKSGNPETAGTSNQPSSRETIPNEKKTDNQIIDFDAEPEDGAKKNESTQRDSQKQQDDKKDESKYVRRKKRL